MAVSAKSKPKESEGNKLLSALGQRMDAYERRINFLERQVKSLTSINKATSTAKATSTEKNDEYIPGDEARLKSSSQKQDEPKSTGTAQKVIGCCFID